MSSRIPEFYRLSPSQRRERLAVARDIPRGYLDAYSPGRGLPVDVAGMMVENVIGVMSLPVGIGLNLLVNRREYIVPMVVEEPSVVAAVSAMAKVTRLEGGIRAAAGPSHMIGQVQVLGCPDPEESRRKLEAEANALIEEADRYVPRLVARGGGMRGLSVRGLVYEEGEDVEAMVVVHLVVDTLDAMGANIVNTLVERMAPKIAAVAGGRVGIRILSNLADQRLVRAWVDLSADALGGKGFTGGKVVDGIVAADRFAFADPYRAATHNKGIMNGIDAVALATGNDWRAIEAGAHAYAARDGRYGPLSRWRAAPSGRLHGSLELPLAVGIVGGTIQVHPTVRANLHVLGVRSAAELAEVMAAVGLAQNLGALRALAAEGIQRGHMSMQARAVALAAGVPASDIPGVVTKMVTRGAIHRGGALAAHRALVAEQAVPDITGREVLGTGWASGKVILLGEHSVVHGGPAVAAALDRGVRVTCLRGSGPVWLEAPEIMAIGELFDEGETPIKLALQKVFSLLDAPKEGLELRVTGDLPPGKGLGSSAALAIASLRAVGDAIGRSISREELLSLGYQVEMVFHGMPSGIDHTVAASGGILRFRRSEPSEVTGIPCPRTFDLVLLDSGEIGPTSVQVGKVLSLLEAHPRRVRSVFEEIGELVDVAVEALQAGDGAGLASCMNRNHELLRALEVSTPRLDRLVAVARGNGAAGAKLTGAGGGGMVVALCPDGTGDLVAAAEEQGIVVLEARIPCAVEQPDALGAGGAGGGASEAPRGS